LVADVSVQGLGLEEYLPEHPVLPVKVDWRKQAFFELSG